MHNACEIEMNSRIFNSIEIFSSFPVLHLLGMLQWMPCHNLSFNVAQVNYKRVWKREGRGKRGRREKIAHAFCIYFNYVKSAWIVGQLNKTHCESLSLSII